MPAQPPADAASPLICRSTVGYSRWAGTVRRLPLFPVIRYVTALMSLLRTLLLSTLCLIVAPLHAQSLDSLTGTPPSAESEAKRNR